MSLLMRILKARIGADSDIAKLNDRQLLILEILAEQKQMSVSELSQNFKEVGQTTISMDLRLLRTRKWTQKKLCPDDERVHLVELTNEGQNTVSKIRTRTLKTFSSLVKVLDGETQSNKKLLNKVVGKVILELEHTLMNFNNA